jgi:hypothetical protein
MEARPRGPKQRVKVSIHRLAVRSGSRESRRGPTHATSLSFDTDSLQEGSAKILVASEEALCLKSPIYASGRPWAFDMLEYAKVRGSWIGSDLMVEFASVSRFGLVVGFAIHGNHKPSIDMVIYVGQAEPRRSLITE